MTTQLKEAFKSAIGARMPIDETTLVDPAQIRVYYFTVADCAFMGWTVQQVEREAGVFVDRIDAMRKDRTARIIKITVTGVKPRSEYRFEVFYCF